MEELAKNLGSKKIYKSIKVTFLKLISQIKLTA